MKIPSTLLDNSRGQALFETLIPLIFFSSLCFALAVSFWSGTALVFWHFKAHQNLICRLNEGPRSLCRRELEKFRTPGIVAWSIQEHRRGTELSLQIQLRGVFGETYVVQKNLESQPWISESSLSTKTRKAL